MSVGKNVPIVIGHVGSARPLPQIKSISTVILMLIPILILIGRSENPY